ncbi:hippurate hydrolase [Pseudoxanthomonas japonensis]|uniref:amidohydrolase n=1 Tax=Pseudoxanthomonas japonensis TaxID=69284 RepID=UPI002859FFF2|nr:amidohydrolase [Pseudoxanthomonas japonensis]MDR7069910.1 hippurate hydrolase [Pseudoxanthomonas japonensis]
MAAVLDPLMALAPRMTEWRHRIHAWPELGFEEERTSALVAEVLAGLGLEVHTGLGGTGVVAVIDSGKPGMSIGLRADMDALPMDEQSDLPFRSQRPGVAHTCGHDGHTSALLGTAQYLVAHPPATGRVVLIFQPAEEGGRGAIKMVEDGLFTRWPCDEVYAFHNMPALKTGEASVRTGATLQSLAVFEIEIEGVGGHAAAPHRANDPLQVAARLAVEISAIVGRHIDPMEAALINVGKLQAGTTHNIIPSTASLSGTMRSLSKDVHEELLKRLRALCEGHAQMTGCKIDLQIPHSCPPCVNAPEQAALAAEAIGDVLGRENVKTDMRAYPFSDDFSYMLEQWPGAYLFLGMDSAMCHHPTFRFDDQLLPVAASVFARIVQRRLG